MGLLSRIAKIFQDKETSPPEEAAASVGKSKRPKNNEVGIVIPIFNAFSDLRRCLAAVTRYSSPTQPIYCINDASTDQEMVAWLEEFSRRNDNVRLISNPESMGYTYNINLGCETHPGDVILLNSDTCVTRGWLQGLVDAAYHRENIATVTPLSNAAGAFSVPDNLARNDIPEGFDIEDLSITLAKTAKPDYPEVPTGNGFCLYIRREALDQFGPFDIENFPVGYGEENDFCFKAKKGGFANIIADNVFVYHRRTASFGEKKSQLLKDGEERLKELHPDYGQAIRAWLDKDPIDPLRDALKANIARCQEERSQALDQFNSQAGDRSPWLYVIFEGEGGTVLTNRDLMSRVAEQHPVLLLSCGPDSWSLYSFGPEEETLLRRYWFVTTWSSLQQIDEERENTLHQICREFGLGLIHFRHLMGMSPEIIKVPRALQVPVIYSIHDYYPFCPTINLIDAKDRYCHADCHKHFETGSECGDCQAPVIWGITEHFGGLRGKGVLEWRRRFQQAFEQCDALVSTSWELHALFGKIFPEAVDKLQIIEHGRDLEYHQASEPKLTAEEKIPIVFLGHLTEAKGAELISRVMKRNVEAGEPFVFHFYGWIDPSLDLPEKGKVAHGKYEREDLPQLLNDLNPAAILIPSIWPETFCHTLTEAWANGIPVLATNLGALKERIEANGGGWLLDAHDDSAWWEVLRTFLEDPSGLEQKRSEISKIRFRTTNEMAREYLDLYSRLTSDS